MMNRSSPYYSVGKVSPALAEQARSIADLALEACEEKLLEIKRRKRPLDSSPSVPSEHDNPFLTRLGSPYMVSRSMKGQGLAISDNLHPFKNTRIRDSESKNNNSSSPEATDNSDWSRLRKRLSPLDAPTYTILILFLSLIIVPRGMEVLKNRFWQWHLLSNRRLAGRRCVMNLFIDKQKKDEFNPDWGDEDAFTLEETHRSKGQLKLITRLIGCVSDSFRTKVNVVQHVVFVGCRDGGHLVQQSLVHWPPRGRHRTNWHIFADGDATDSLSYQHVAALEQRFNQFDEYVHLYDSKGNIAGKIEEDLDEDEDEILGGNEKRIPETSLEAGDFKAVLWDSDEVEINVIPYFHIDGTSFDTQMEILDKAKTLLKSHTISVVGIEHSPDLSIQELVEFFTAVNYKTFMLGLRQLYRIDNICPEVMENVLDHPTFRRRRRLFSTGKDYQQAPTPPYFVAMPKGRHGFEEMTIQTMYDLFSGSGGGGQVKTANDRKAPGKK